MDPTLKDSGLMLKMELVKLSEAHLGHQSSTGKFYKKACMFALDSYSIYFGTVT